MDPGQTKDEGLLFSGPSGLWGPDHTYDMLFERRFGWDGCFLGLRIFLAP
jgi:hypothetical protein